MPKRFREPRRTARKPGHGSGSSLPQLIQENALLQSRNQLLLMYSNFQTEMPSDGQTGIGTWLRERLRENGMPSLIRFGPRSRPQVFRKDEFADWFHSSMPAVSSNSMIK